MQLKRPIDLFILSLRPLVVLLQHIIAPLYLNKLVLLLLYHQLYCVLLLLALLYLLLHLHDRLLKLSVSEVIQICLGPRRLLDYVAAFDLFSLFCSLLLDVFGLFHFN